MQSGTETCPSHPTDRSSTTPTLLCVGNEEALLSYRCKVLVQAGFQVIPVRPQPEQNRQFASLCRLHGPAVVVACHTLSPEQRIALAGELRDACPTVRLLALTNGAMTPAEAAGYDVLLDSLDGPAALIHQVRKYI